MRQKCGPDLPPDCVLVLAVEVLELQGLLQLLEQKLDFPSCLVKRGNRRRRPCEVVRDEDHVAPFAVDEEVRRDATQAFGISGIRVLPCQQDRLVGDDVLREILLRDAFDDFHLHAVLLAHDEEPAPCVVSVKQVEGVVGTVEDRDVAFLERCEQFLRLLAVVVFSLVDQAEVRQSASDVRDHVELDRGLLLPVLGPSDAPVGEADRRRVDRIDAARTKPRERTFARALDESRILLFQLLVHVPEELLDDLGVSCSVCVRERVELGWDDPPDAREFRGIDLRDVDELVQAEQMQQLSEHQQVNLRVVRELPRLDLLARREFGDLPSWKITCHDLL